MNLKTTTENKTESTSDIYESYFTIHRFMTEELGLGGAKLLVYALIYSFTVSEGSFFGSRGYICEICGITDSTAGRVLKELVSMGLLKREERSNFQTVKYKAIIPTTERTDAKDEAQLKCVPPLQNLTPQPSKKMPPPSNSVPSPSKMTDNNKDYNKTNIHTSIHAISAYANAKEDTEEVDRFAEGNTDNVRVIHEGKNKAEEVERLKREIDAGTFRGDIKVPGDIFLEDELIQRKHGLIDAKRNKDDDLRCVFSRFGYQEMVQMTDAQYDYLARTYGEDTVEEYIQRLEHTILTKPGFRAYSHYKTIIRWLKEDMQCADAFAPA